jgi:hypothetical protein
MGCLLYMSESNSLSLDMYFRQAASNLLYVDQDIGIDIPPPLRHYMTLRLY